MMLSKHVLGALLFALAAAGSADAVTTGARPVVVGGAPMLPSRTIVQNAVASKDHSVLVSALQAAGMIDTLSGPGPFTVFAPTNEAFAKLPPGTVESLLKPANQGTLTDILNYHVVAGRMDSKAIAAAMKAGKGRAVLHTIGGGDLTASMAGDRLVLSDAKGGTSTVTITDVHQSNGVVHVVDTVLMPR